MTGPCNASPVHNSLVTSASNRPNVSGGEPLDRMFNPRSMNSRWIVRRDGDQPRSASMMRTTCAAVRAGRSRFNATARSMKDWGIFDSALRDSGTNAANPPARHARIHRSIVERDTTTRSPFGPR